jgi:hypothetical protein
MIHVLDVGGYRMYASIASHSTFGIRPLLSAPYSTTSCCLPRYSILTMKAASLHYSLAIVFLLGVWVRRGTSFSLVPRKQTIWKHHPSAAYHPPPRTHHLTTTLWTRTCLLARKDDDEVSDDNFDGQGFASYLAPYLVTAIASIVVTGLFVKFVLMDY